MPRLGPLLIVVIFLDDDLFLLSAGHRQNVFIVFLDDRLVSVIQFDDGCAVLCADGAGHGRAPEGRSSYRCRNYRSHWLFSTVGFRIESMRTICGVPS